MTPARYALRAIYWLLLIVSPALIAGYMPSTGDTIIPGRWRIALAVLGAALIVLGIYLNAIAGRLLRIYGHTVRTRRFTAPDRLVRAGPYSCMRHPAQLGLILVGVGVGVITGRLVGMLSAFIPVSGGLLFILHVEEPEARRLLGYEYHEYEEEVPPFSLNPKCLFARTTRRRGN